MQEGKTFVRFAAISSWGLLAFFGLFSRFPRLVDSIYADTLFPTLVRLPAFFSSLVPFSLGEVLLAGTTVLILLAAARSLFRLLAGGRRLGTAIKSALLQLAAVAGVVLTVFYLFWGLNYARPDAVQRLGWDGWQGRSSTAEQQAEELFQVARQAVGLANAAYFELHGTEDLGEPSQARQPIARLDAAIDAGFAAAARQLELEPTFELSLGRAKPAVLSKLMSHFGLTGFYFPWTAEANYNHEPPDVERIHAIAHEKAHQRGVASEDEAGFYGFLACVSSPEPYPRYSGYAFAQSQLLGQLARVDPEKASAAQEERFAGVSRDEAAIRQFWDQYRGSAMKVGLAVNDSYLKVHGVKGGIESYSHSARLLVLLARSNRGGLALSRPDN